MTVTFPDPSDLVAAAAPTAKKNPPASFGRHCNLRSPWMLEKDIVALAAHP